MSPRSRGIQKRPSRVMDPFKETVDQWLKEDFKQKKKFRRTAKRKKELLNEASEAALPLEHQPGMAQVDFGEAPFIHKGEQVTLPYLVLSYPYSNSFYFQVFPSQKIECFLEGMKRIFHHVGSVPKVIRFDNLSAAVKKVLPNGERQLTESFENFVSHYGFHYEFCNPGSGNEKGHVESMVKYVRNNFLLPALPVLHIEDLNGDFWKQAEVDRHRPHFDKRESIEELFQKDKQASYVLPTKAYECVLYETLKADKYGYVHFEKNQYSTSPRYALQKVLIKIHFDRIEILSDMNETIISHSRMYGVYRKSMEWQPYLRLMAKRPLALKYTTFYSQLPDEWQRYFNRCTSTEKSDALKLLSFALKDRGFEQITEALTIASEHGHPSAESISQVFYQLINGRGIRPTIKPKQTLPSMPKASRGLSHYDQLLKVVNS